MSTPVLTTRYTKMEAGMNILLPYFGSLAHPPEPAYDFVKDWFQRVFNAANDTHNDTLKPGDAKHHSLADCVAALISAKTNLKTVKARVRSNRLGLRMAGVRLNGPYGLPALAGHATTHGEVKKFARCADHLGERVRALLDAIQQFNKVPVQNAADRDGTLSDLHEFTSLLYTEYLRAGKPAIPQIVSFLSKLEDGLEEPGAKVVPPGDTSSYWPSSFIASSSSSSTTPP
jgi:hypothetical protein